MVNQDIAAKEMFFFVVSTVIYATDLSCLYPAFHIWSNFHYYTELFYRRAFLVFLGKQDVCLDEMDCVNQLFLRRSPWPSAKIGFSRGGHNAHVRK